MALENDTPVLSIEADGEPSDVLLAEPVRRQLEAEILPHYIMVQRWYGAKDAGPPAVAMAGAVPFASEGTSVLLAILSVTPPGGESQDYFLPLTFVPEEARLPAAACIARVESGTSVMQLVDAFATDGFVRALIAALQSGATTYEGLAFDRTAALAETIRSPRSDLRIERGTAEQSNTSMRVGEAMLKGFRRLEPGIHPEVEISAFLTQQAHFANVPAFLGSVGRMVGGERVALCVLQALVPNEGDGWTFTLARLAEAEADERAADTLLRLAERLGERTAGLHKAFAVDTRDDAFAAEPVKDHHLVAWSEEVRRQAEIALAGLERAKANLAPEIATGAIELLGRRQDLLAAIEASTPCAVTAMRTRLHGDFHLGQVLVSNEDVFLIDFEGEPMRSLAERRIKHSPLRDVAGMVRSFAYAGAAAQRGTGPGTQSSDAPDKPAFVSTMSERFLRAYAASIPGCPSFPADPVHADQLLQLFLLEKALYEVNYELANRPDWLDLPIGGVLGLLDRSRSSGFPDSGTTSSPASSTSRLSR